MKKICIHVPCYNEEGNVRAMAEKLIEIMDGTAYNYEIFFVDNCSTDQTVNILRELAKSNKKIKVIVNTRNYGLSWRNGRNAMRYMHGDAYIYIPCDFQEPPELIPKFIEAWENGYKIVIGQKIASNESKIKYKLRCVFYKIIDYFSEAPQLTNASGIVLRDKEAIERLAEDYDSDVSVRFAVADLGYDVKLIQYKQNARKSGKSSYNIWRNLSFAIHSLTITSTKPLRIITVLGIIMSSITFAIGAAYLVLKFIFWNRFQAGMAPILIGMFFWGLYNFCLWGLLENT